MKAFKAYDIRGVYGKDFDREDVYLTGYYLPRLLECSAIVVGRDVRVSSEEIYQALCEGITDAGADVYSIGHSTTPMLYYAVGKHGFQGGVQITASHNPAEYNGMKVTTSGALPVGYDAGLYKIERWMQEHQSRKLVAKKGSVKDFSILDEYCAFQRKLIPASGQAKVAIDCSSGMAGLLVKSIYGKGPLYLNAEPDGRFPAHSPNPLETESQQQVKEAVIANGCHAGILFDGDADRVMFVDERGNFISPDLIIALLGHQFIHLSPGRVLQDIRTSRSVEEYLRPLGFEVHTWRVGRAFATPKLREINGIYGGELAGHYYFRDFFFSDSGILACSYVLQIIEKLAKKGHQLSEKIKHISKYHSSGEINMRVENKEEVMNRVRDHFISDKKPLHLFDFDGYRLDYSDWWFNIRPSNTEPYLRLIVEASNEGMLQDRLGEIEQVISTY